MMKYAQRLIATFFVLFQIGWFWFCAENPSGLRWPLWAGLLSFAFVIFTCMGLFWVAWREYKENQLSSNG